MQQPIFFAIPRKPLIRSKKRVLLTMLSEEIYEFEVTRSFAGVFMASRQERCRNAFVPGASQVLREAQAVLVNHVLHPT